MILFNVQINFIYSLTVLKNCLTPNIQAYLFIQNYGIKFNNEFELFHLKCLQEFICISKCQFEYFKFYLIFLFLYIFPFINL